MIFLQTFCRITMFLPSFIEISFVFLISVMCCYCWYQVLYINNHILLYKKWFWIHQDCYNSTKLRFSYRTNTNGFNGTMSVWFICYTLSWKLIRKWALTRKLYLNERIQTKLVDFDRLKFWYMTISLLSAA